VNKVIRWGILGTGNIAGQFARGLRDTGDCELVAVGSRSLDKARRFGQEFDVRRCHGSYGALADDAAVDVVYIATPHPLHAENIALCLQAGKAVLCEKPLTLNAQQAGQAIALAQKKKLFLMEAMWTRFLPPIVRLRAMLAEGIVGEPRIVSADLGFCAPWEEHNRFFDLALGGGCLLDVGVYPLSLAAMVLGAPSGISGQAYIGKTGVDEQDAICLSYEGGRLACLYCSIRTQTPEQASVIGTKGHVHLYSNWWKGGPMMVRIGQRSLDVNVPVEGNGYQYEAIEVAHCLRTGQTQSQTMPLEQSLSVVRTMDALRSQWGVGYPME
jgi:predicted dehydrogenase